MIKVEREGGGVGVDGNEDDVGRKEKAKGL